MAAVRTEMTLSRTPAEEKNREDLHLMIRTGITWTDWYLKTMLRNVTTPSTHRAGRGGVR